MNEIEAQEMLRKLIPAVKLFHEQGYKHGHIKSSLSFGKLDGFNKDLIMQ
jgi:hypothetical protein